MSNNSQYKSKRKESDSEKSMVFGKVPPQALEFETAVLGAIMLERDAFDVVSEILQPECFYSNAHQVIYQAMQNLAVKNLPIDSLSVCQELISMGEIQNVGGMVYVSKLTNGVVSAANIEHHSRVILEKYLLREVIRIGGEMMNMGYDDTSDVFEVLDIAEDSVSNLRLNNVKKHFRSLQDIIYKNFQQIEQLRLREDDIIGVSSGFESLDKATNGWQNTDLIILAARPSVGKTAFSLSLCVNAAKSFCDKWIQEGRKPGEKKSVGFFSLEMSDRQLVNRMLASKSGIFLSKLGNGKISETEMRELYRTSEKMNEYAVFVDETAALKISDFRAKAKRLVKKHNCGLIVVDYLQLMKDPTKKMREQEISSISGQLKQTAKELNVPIIALSQLNRDMGKNGNREPQLYDLRESGAIEQDADVVTFLFRPSDAEMQEDRNLETVFFLSIAKHRNGEAPLKFIGDFDKRIQRHAWLKPWDNNVQVKNSEQALPMEGNWKAIDQNF